MKKLVQTLNFPVLGDDRGSLIALEPFSEVPFDIKRVYYIFGTKEGVARGFHAHRDLQQNLIAVSGSCKILLDDGVQKEEVLLDSPETGLIVDKLVWHEMYEFSEDCVLLVLASDLYDESDYIRDYKEFLQVLKCKS